ncbi:MAG: amino acid permease [Knoellia sp.]
MSLWRPPRHSSCQWARSAESDAALLEVVKAGVLPVPVGVMTILFAVMAMTAITNTTLVAVVTQSRILYGMAREDVVPGVFGRIHASRRSPWVALSFAAAVVCGLLIVGAVLNRVGVGVDVVERLALVTVVFTLFIYALVIISALKLRGQEEREDVYHAPTPLLWAGIVGNVLPLGYVVIDDPGSLIWCAGLLALGGMLFAAEMVFGRPGHRGDQDETDSAHLSEPTSTNGA